jgi:hypothetical protein
LALSPVLFFIRYLQVIYLKLIPFDLYALYMGGEAGPVVNKKSRTNPTPFPLCACGGFFMPPLIPSPSAHPRNIRVSERFRLIAVPRQSGVFNLGQRTTKVNKAVDEVK